MKTDDYIGIGALALGGFLIYKLMTPIQNVSDTLGNLTGTASDISGALRTEVQQIPNQIYNIYDYTYRAANPVAQVLTTPIPMPSSPLANSGTIAQSFIATNPLINPLVGVNLGFAATSNLIAGIGGFVSNAFTAVTHPAAASNTPVSSTSSAVSSVSSSRSQSSSVSKPQPSTVTPYMGSELQKVLWNNPTFRF